MRLSRNLRLAVATALVGLLCFAGTSAVYAQTTSASVFGAVKDSQGGVMPGATVTLTSRTQANTLTATTDAEGRFVFPIVRPDHYIAQGHACRASRPPSGRTWWSTRTTSSRPASIALEVGGIEESVSVSGRVSELQTASGERSFTLESEALKNIANNGRTLFNFATLVPGVLSQNSTAGARAAAVSGFTVNGQRPNSNNMTIDGVANIDTGDNGGNMATTNIDAVARVQDPDERLPGRVRPRGGRAGAGRHQERHAVLPRLGLLVRPALRLEREHLDQQARRPRRRRSEAVRSSRSRRSVAQRLRLHARRPDLHPGRLQRGEEEALLLLEPGVPEAHEPRVRARRPACPPRSSAPGTSRRASTPAATRSPTSATTRPGCPAARATPAAASRTAASSARSPRAASTRPASRRSTSSPQPNFTAGSGVNYRARTRTTRRGART